MGRENLNLDSPHKGEQAMRLSYRLQGSMQNMTVLREGSRFLTLNKEIDGLQ